VDRLLQDPRLSPTAGGNEPIRAAGESGHLSVVDRLLRDHRVDCLVTPGLVLSVPIARPAETATCLLLIGYCKITE